MKEEMEVLRDLFNKAKAAKEAFLMADGLFQEKWFEFLKNYCGAQDNSSVHMFELFDVLLKSPNGH